MLALHRSKSDSDPSWFAACPDLAAIREPAWLEAAKAAQRHNIRARQRLFSDHELNRSFLIVIKGSVQIYKSERDREIALF